MDLKALLSLWAEAVPAPAIKVMVAIAAALIPILWTGFRVSRAEGAALFAAYCGYVYFLWPK